MELLSLLPKYKNCINCSSLLTQIQNIDNTYYFTCKACNQVTEWNTFTIFNNCKISPDKIEKLLTLFLDNKTASEADSILKYSFVNQGLNIKTIYRYYELFNNVVYDYVDRKMRSAMLNGEVELDETYLFKEKKSKAPHRPYKNSSQWLFGMRQRNSSNFLVFPVEERNKETLIPLIIKHIEIYSTIYSDSFSVYVNNRTTPKKSHLNQYGYIHKFVNHKIEFVNKLFQSIHTNTIESLWKEIKNYLRKSRSTNKYLFIIYRYYFTKEISKEIQLELLINCLQTESFI